MVGLERTVLPLLGEQEFGLASRASILAFVASFGATKALANLAAGRLADRVGRKAVLLVGWAIGLLVPIVVIAAPTWGWVVFANALLGVNQGLCWSATVMMKLDLVVPARFRGRELASPCAPHHESGGPRQQPERRRRLGAASAVLRGSRSQPRRGRSAGRDVPGRVGPGAARDGCDLRRGRTQATHRRWHGASGVCARGPCPVRWLAAVARS